MTKKSKIRKGDMVIVQSLDKTTPMYHSNEYMRKMVGKEFEIADVDMMNPRRPRVYIRQRGGQQWTFHPDDLELVNSELVDSESMPKDKIFFDPKELV